MTGWARIALRMQRAELLILAVALVALAGVLGFAAWQFASVHAAYPACFGPDSLGGLECIAAQDQLAPWANVFEIGLSLAWASPVAIGVVLGTPIVAREIEQQTASISWSLAASRTRWLIERTWPVLLVTLVALACVGLAAEVLAQNAAPDGDPGFGRYDQRGPLLAARGILALTVALAVGAQLGRVLPALLIAPVITVLLLLMVSLGLGQWRLSEAEIVLLGSDPGDGLVLDDVAVLPDGSVITREEASRLPEDSFSEGSWVLPADAYGAWLAREAALLLALTAAGFTCAVAIVRKRRPL